jgi:hypothetical protein
MLEPTSQGLMHPDLNKKIRSMGHPAQTSTLELNIFFSIRVDSVCILKKTADNSSFATQILIKCCWNIRPRIFY